MIARRKFSRKLEDIAAFIVARHIAGETDTKELSLPKKNLKKYIHVPLYFLCGFIN